MTGTDLSDIDLPPLDDADARGDEDDGEIVLPWWQNPLNIIALLIGVLALAGGAGFVLGERHATPSPNATDIGFLQDMRTHHEQAVNMSLTFMLRPGADPTMATIAQEIVVDQSVDSGRMIQLLRQYGKPEANQTEETMGWMGAPVPESLMPGYASDADLQTLASSSGEQLNQLFGKLMIAHHEGGIQMARYAAAHAAEKEVRDFATAMISSEQDEIVELRNLLATGQTS